jgi:hypothetical protein
MNKGGESLKDTTRILVYLSHRRRRRHHHAEAVRPPLSLPLNLFAKAHSRSPSILGTMS